MPAAAGVEIPSIAPDTRVAALDCHVPYEPTLELAVLPQVADIEAAADGLLHH